MSSNNSLQSFTQSNDNKNYSGGDLFDKSSFKEKSEGKGYTNYMLNEEIQYYIINDLAFFILSDSKFIISVKYDKEKNVAIITYKEIICRNQKFKIEEIKDLKSEDFNLNNCYKKFINYLTNFETDLREKYKKETETEIILEIKKKDDDYNKVDCKLTINGGMEEQRKESCFIDEDFLNENKHTGSGCLLDEIE